MKVISIAGISGGVGATTVAAQLAAGLVAHNQRVIAFDLSPHNALRLHFGMPWDDGSGLVPQVLADKPWNEVAYHGANGVDFFPFGKTTHQDSASFISRLAREPGWLNSRLQELDEAEDAYVIIDSPNTEHTLSSQAYAASGLAITVLEPDTFSFAAFIESRTAQSEAGNDKKTVYLLNGFDPTRALDRDISRLLRATPNNNLCPVIIHRDELVREALANKSCLNDYAPYSPAAGDFIALTTWVIATFAHFNSAT